MTTVLYPSPVFGPVESRRLGLSLGVNLLPADGKLCDFDCVYCECGYNASHRPRSRPPTPRAVLSELERVLSAARDAGRGFDSITFAGNGEPTLHPRFPEIAARARELRDRYLPRARLCLLSNATRLGDEAVFSCVARDFDQPCLKLDTVDPDYIALVNRPQTPYRLPEILDRLRALGRRCVIQTMFLKGSWRGHDVDNTGDRYVLPWVEAVRSIGPAWVDIYTICRATPGRGLRPARIFDLNRIVRLLRAAGLDAQAYL